MVNQFKRRTSSKANQDHWDRRYKIASLFATAISACSIILGGIFALYTYYQQSAKENEIKKEELRTRNYNQLREMYFQLVDAAAAVGSATSREIAFQKLTEFDRLYFGRAHIYVLDPNVSKAKRKFYWNVHDLIHTEQFPSREISNFALKLSMSCQEHLKTLDPKKQD